MSGGGVGGHFAMTKDAGGGLCSHAPDLRPMMEKSLLPNLLNAKLNVIHQVNIIIMELKYV